MKLRFNSKGKWRMPTIHITGIPRDLLSVILEDAKATILREMAEKPAGPVVDYNQWVLTSINEMLVFLEDTFPGKEATITD